MKTINLLIIGLVLFPLESMLDDGSMQLTSSLISVKALIDFSSAAYSSSTFNPSCTFDVAIARFMRYPKSVNRMSLRWSKSLLLKDNRDQITQ